MIVIKKHCNRNENVFDGLISRLDIGEEWIFEVEHITIETSKSEKKKAEKTEKGTDIKNCGTSTKRAKYM